MGTDRKQFDMFFDKMLDGFAYHKIVVDKAGKPVDYVFLEVNHAFEKMTGLKRERIIGKKVTEILPGIEKDPANWIGVYGKVALTGEPVQFENQAEPLGKWFKVIAYCPEKNHFVALFEDITERKKSEEALRVSEEKANALIKHAPTGIYEIDYRVPKFKNVNDAMCAILGYTREELLAMSPFALLDDESKVRFKERIMKLLAGEKVDETVEFKVKRKDGREIYAVLNVMFTYKDRKPESAVVIAHDVTERKKTEDKLRESEQRWATTLASIGDAVIATNVSSKIVFMNSVAEEMTGWSLNEARQKPLKGIFKIINEQTRREIEDPVSKVLEKGLVVGLANHSVLIRKDRTRVPIDDSGAPIKDKDGKITGVVLVFRDITERKQNEEKISQQAFMIANANDAIIGYDLEQKVTFWNKAAQQMYGYTSEEALGKVGGDLLKPTYIITPRKELLSQLKRTGHLETESVRSAKNARKLNIEAHVILLRNEAGKPIGYVSVDRDITECKKAQEELSKLNEELEERVRKRTEQVSSERQRLYNVLETLPAYVILLDKDYHVPFANKIFRERFGESHGKRCYEYLFKRDTSCENCETYKVLKTDEPHHWEWTGPDNRDYDIYDFPFAEEDGSTLILEMGIDITERKRAEKRVRDAALYSRSLIEASLDPLVTINAKGEITDVNQATELATGRSKEELIGSHFSDYFTEPEKAENGYKQVFTQGFVRDYPLAIKNRSGKIIDVLYNATVYRNEAGEIQGVFAAARDITQQKKAEELAQESAKKLKDAERLAAIGATAGMVGHDIRNPLQAIVSDVYLAKTELAHITDSEGKNSALESLDEIEKNVDYINKIVKDLQDYARPLNPKSEQTNFKEIVKKLFSKNSLPKNVKVTVKVADEATEINADSYYINRIMYNLVTNSIQAMPKGGKLTIQAYKEANETVIAVTDTGVGIPKDIQNKMFTPMFTTKSKGQGFGLPVVKRMAESLGGTVTFESQEGKGTTFKVRLPTN
jgi:PAS domain S-box-containing protein